MYVIWWATIPQSCFVLMTSPSQAQTAHLKQPITYWLAGSWNCLQLLPFSIMNQTILLWHFERLFNHYKVILLKQQGAIICLVIMHFSLMTPEIISECHFMWKCILLIINSWIVSNPCIRSLALWSRLPNIHYC